MLTRVGLDDLLEPELMVPDALLDEVALLQPFVGSGEIGDVDGDVVIVIGRDLVVRLAEGEPLIGADPDLRRRALTILLQRGGRAQYLLVETDDAGRCAAADLDL